MAGNMNDARISVISKWLDVALQQVAAESYLNGIDLASNQQVSGQLLRGNSPVNPASPGAGPDQYIRLTQSQAAAFLAEHEIVDHHANDASGFSATLLRRKIADPITGAQAGEYSLSFRSTEYKNPSQGGDFDRDGLTFRAIDRADGEVAFAGFAQGQIAAMEAYYERLKQGITSTDPDNTAQLNTSGKVSASIRDFFGSPSNTFSVVGYSLGAHLATVFTERHQSVVAQTHTFNAAGRGTLGRTVPGLELSRYGEMFSYFNSVLLNPDAAGLRVSQMPKAADVMLYTAARRAAAAPGNDSWNPFELTPANLALDLTRRNLYPDARYRWALYATKQKFVPQGLETSASDNDTTVDFGAFARITQLFGHANFGDSEVTANSGVHAPTTSIFIEAQPFLESAAGKLPFAPELTEALSGLGDFGNTHSLTLIIDSLATMEAFMTVDANLTKRQVEAILSGASNQGARRLALVKNDTNAEGNSLEAPLDVLRKLYGAQGVRFVDVGGIEQELRFDFGTAEWITPVDRQNGGFGDAANRRIFHRNIELLKDKIAEKGSATIASLVPANQFLAENGEPLPDATGLSADFIADKAKQQDPEGLAYRYALRELNPFLVTGNDTLYAGLQNELSYYNASTGEGALSEQFIDDRAKFLAHKLTFNVNNKFFDRSLDSVSSEFFADFATNDRISFLTNLLHSAASTLRDQQDQTKFDRFFASVDYDERTLFGKDDSTKKYEDNLLGNRSIDRLYGGRGDDRLDGRAAADFLDGGVGKDQLYGGAGDDELLGGKDADVLRGGEGSDTYIWRRGDGFDTIIDFAGDGFGGDGLGKIESLGVDLSGNKQLWDPATNDKLFKDANYFYALTGELGTRGMLTIVKNDEASGFGGIRIEGFRNGDLGINLVGAPTFTKTDQGGTGGNDDVSIADAFKRFFGFGGNDRILISGMQAEGWGGFGDDFVFNDEGDQTLRGEEGRDILLASGGADTLDGGAENDALQGGEGGDALDGGDGNDVLDGGLGSDVVNGGAGDDFLAGGGTLVVGAPWSSNAVPEFGAYVVAGQPTGLIGMSGAVALDADAGDVLDGGAGNDTLFAGSGEDFAEGGEGDDLVSGDAGADTLTGGDGADSLFGDSTQGSITIGGQDFYTLPEFHGNDVLLGGLGDDTLQGDGGADELYGGEDNDVLLGDANGLDESFHGADYLDGGEGNDVLLGYGKDDTLFGGAGDDTLGGDSSSIADSTHGADYLDGEDGADTLHGDGGADTLFGGAGDDILDGDASNVAFEFHGDDDLEGEEGNDALQGGGGSDRLFGGAGNDSLAGDVAGIPAEFAGNDYLDGEAGNDILDGGAGNDTLVGGAGVDILRGQAGDDLYLVEPGSQNDFIQDREGMNTVRLGAPVTFVFQALGTDGKAYLGLRYSGSDLVHLQEGLTNHSMRTELADGTMRSAADWRASFTQFVTVPGGAGADTLSGTALAESFSPGAGNDTILFERGSGFDRVTGFGQVTGGAQGLDRIQLGEGIALEDLLVRNIAGHLTLTIADTGDTLRLDNWYSSAAQTHAGAQVQFADGTPLSGADLIALALASSDANDLLAGGNAAEVISGGLGNDAMTGGDGADTMLGGEGDDSLSGGLGTDTLDGGAGNDALRGDAGADVYLFGAGDGSDTIQDTGADANVVQFKPGITPADVTLNQGSIVVTLNATGDTLTIADWYREDTTGPKFSVRELRFAGGTTWDAALINENANHATPFADLLRGIDTADTLYGLSGDDTIEGFAGDDVLVGGDGSDILDGGAGADDLDGGAGNDTLKGGANGDVLDGGAGDDTLDGGADENIFLVGKGNDTVFAGADDALVFGEGVESEDVVVTRAGAGYRLDFGFGSVRLVNSLIREVRFSDGTAWDQGELDSRVTQVGVSILGDDADNAITGSGADDSLDGGAGDDLIQGGLGTDLIRGGEGNDRLYGHTQSSPQGDTAANQLFGDAGADQLFGGAGSEVLDGGAGNDSISAGGGDDSLLGGAGSDSLNGDAGNDTLDGGEGDDTMHGGFGSDIYRFGRASGHDTASVSPEVQLLGGLIVPTTDLDVIQVDAGIAPSEIVVSRSGAFLVIATSDGIASVKTALFAAELGPAGLAVRFADGTEWDTATLMALAGSPPSTEVVGTSGNDSLFGGGGDDLLVGLEGNDSLDANAGNDRLEGGAGDDTLIGGQGDDTLDGGAGNDLLVGGFGSDTYVFGYGWGNDTISEQGDTSPPTLTQALAGERDRILFAPGVGPEDVVLQLDGSGSETIALLGSIDALTISGVEYAEFEDGTVWDLGRLPLPSLGTGSTRHFGIVGSDSRTLGADDDIFFGLGGSDSLTDLSGHNTLYGNELNDTLSTGVGDDVLSGGAGNDNFSPRSGDNVIRFGRGAGQDTLTLARHFNDVGSDTVVFGEDVRLEHLRLRRGPNATLIVEIAGTPDSLTIQDDFNANQGRPRLRFQFADGTLWDAAQIEAHIQAVALIEGGTGNNTLVGGDGVDVFIGGPGNDTLTGGGGQDTFVFVRGDGADTIIDEAPRIVFGEGILPQDVTLSPSNFAAGLRDLIVTVGGGGGQITARNWFPSTHAGAIEFADGTVWDSVYVGTRVPFTFVSGATGSYTGTLGNDTFTMGSTADTMRGEAGDDTLAGDGGNDQLFGGAGNDVLSGGVGNDNLQGEAGNDLLDAGVDTLGAGETDSDSLSGGDGDDVLLGRAGGDGLAGGAGNDTLDAGAGDDALAGGVGNDTLSGGAGNDLLEAGSGDDFLDGGAGDDRLYGGSGSDVYLFGTGSGSDTLLDFDATGSAIDTIRMGAGVTPQDVEVAQDGADLILRLTPGGDSLKIRSFGREGYGVERVVFEDGTTWDAAQLAGLATLAEARERADVIFGSAGADVFAGLGGDDVLDGGAGADALDGGSGDDVLLGGAGDDTLDGGTGFDHLAGGAGADTFVIGVDSGSDAIADLGLGDTLTLGSGISAADVRIARDRDHLYLEAGTTGQFITLENWFANGANGTVAFSDGTLWEGVFLEATVDTPTDGDDFLVGTDSSETISPLAGLDTVFAGAGDDVVLGGEGSDSLYGEDGHDALLGEAGFDLLVGGEGDDAIDGGADDDALFGDQGNDSLIGGEGFDELSGGTGNDVLDGGSGDDILQADAGDDTLLGGEGNDALNGGTGNDVYVYSMGSGSDTITESESTVSTADVLRLSSVSPSEVGFRRFSTHTVLEISGSADAVIIREMNFAQSLVIERVEFDDGTVWNQTDIGFQTINVGTEGNDFLSGFKGLVGLGGNDTLNGGPGDNVLDGGDGADTLNGSTGNDRLIGGAGNDTLNGGAGDDEYVFGGGSGDDTVSNFDSAPGRRDVLAFTAEVAPEDVIVQQIGNHLRVSLNGGADRLRVDNWFNSPDFQLTEATFADGTLWSAAELESRIVLAAPTDGDDALIGLTGDDTIDGLGGNDRLEGGAGNDVLLGNSGNDTLLGGIGADTLDGGAGDDSLDGGAGNDLYVFGPGMGSDTISEVDSTFGNVDAVLLDALPAEVTVTQQFPHLVLTLAGGERLTLLNWSSGGAQKVEEVRFTDGTVWDVAALTARSIVPVFGTEDSDFLQGTSGADSIDALGGNDVIWAGAGSDSLLGGAGDDTLNAESGNDMLDGGTGNDTLNGSVGNDTYRFAVGYGLDTINEFDTTQGNVDVVEVDGLPADATLRRAGSSLELRLAGDVLVVTGWFTNFAQQVELVRFSDGMTWDVPTLDTLAHADLPRTGTALADTLYGTNDADTLEGLEGNDRLEGRGGDDVLVGGAGTDTLVGGAGDDIYRFAAGDGLDTINEQSGFDVLEFSSGITPDDVGVRRIGDSALLTLFGGTQQLTLASWANSSTSAFRVEEIRFADGTVWDERFIFDAVRASDAADFVRVGAGGERIDAMQGNDVVLGGAGDDELLGNAGDDTLSGEAGADTLDGGAGRDFLQGGLGDDRFVFASGYGSDWISDSGGLDEVVFGPGLTTDSVIFTRDLSDLFATTGPDRLTLVDWFTHQDFRVESFRFGDGTVLSEGGVRSRIRPALPGSINDTIFGSDAGEAISGLAGEDALYGEGGNDTLDGGDGSDYMVGGPGDDTYLVDIRLDRVTEDPDEGVDTVVASASYALSGNVENLTLSGSGAINGTGNDLDNVIVGNTGANVLDGGAGNDSLRGGTGNEVYVVRRGDGMDEIIDVDPTAGNQDTVRFGAEVAPSQVRVSRIDDDILLRIAGGGEVFLRDWFDPTHRIESVTFADGTVWDAATIEFLSTLPSNQPPTVSAPIADLGVLEDSTFEFSVPEGTFTDPDAGDMLAYAAARADGSPLPDWLMFDPAAAAFSGTPENGDVGALDVLVTATDALGESASDVFRVEVQNVNDAPIVASPLGDRIGRETEFLSFVLSADAFADVDAGDALVLAAGLEGTAMLPSWLAFDPSTGAFLGAPGPGDAGSYQIQVTATDNFGASAADVFDLVIESAGGQGQIIVGTPGDDVLAGTPFDDILDGLGGSDRLAAGAGNDMLLYSEDDRWDGLLRARHVGSPGRAGTGETESIAGKNRSHDLFDGGEGFDALVGTDGHDALFLEDRFSPPDGHDGPRLTGIEYIATGEGHDLVDLTSRRFGYDDVVLDGGDGNDVLWASAGNDVLIGGRGDDELSGGAGEDVYFHGLLDGRDVIEEAGVSGQLDVLRFGEGITRQMVRVRRDHRDLILDVEGPHGSVTIKDWFDSSSKRVERIEFADGSGWDEAAIRERVQRRDSEGWCDPQDGRGHGRDDDHHGHHGRDERDDRRHDKHDDGPRRNDDWHGGRHGKPAHFDFDDFHKNARGWSRVQAYANRLAAEDHDDPKHGAPTRGGKSWSLLGAALGGGMGWGYDGSVGASRGPEDLKSLEGLMEGFRRL